VPNVCLEVGSKRTFAIAIDWPGWARAAKSSDDALEALASYADRYQRVLSPAGIEFTAPVDFAIVEERNGDTTTDFGAPGQHFARDLDAAGGDELEHLIQVWEASWHALDGQALVSPAELRKGPRGGGRDRSQMIGHVVEADRAYARKIDVRVKPLDPHDRLAVARLHTAMIDGAIATNETHPNGYTAVPDKAWTVRYLIRRSAWHALDHAWEMADRSD